MAQAKKEPPISNISQGGWALLKVNSTDEYEAVNGPAENEKTSMISNDTQSQSEHSISQYY